MANAKEKCEDARIRKTKIKLYSAFFALLSKKQFEDITVNEICLASEIRRATFYKHFTDKYDFFAKMTAAFITAFEERERESINKRRGYGVEYHIAYVRELMHFLTDNEALIRLIINSNMMATLIHIIVRENYTIVKEWLEDDVANGARLIASPDTVATMLAGGISNIAIKWFYDDMKKPLGELITETEALIRAMFIN